MLFELVFSESTSFTVAGSTVMRLSLFEVPLEVEVPVMFAYGRAVISFNFETMMINPHKVMIVIMINPKREKK